jgi:hypothetical protein
MSWTDNLTKYKLTKAILAMSNIEYGGKIILGIEQLNNSFVLEGMNPSDLLSFNYDEMSAFVSKFADPYVKFSMKIIDNENNKEKKFLLLNVEPFVLTPVTCKKDSDPGDAKSRLKKGVIYTRTTRIPESAEVSSVNELREIIDIAVDRGVRRFIQMAQNNQLFNLTEISNLNRKNIVKTRLQELQQANKSVFENIEKKGYWSVIASPFEFSEENIELSRCKEIVEASVVEFRNYNYPHFSQNCAEILRGINFVEWSCDINPGMNYQSTPKSIWRFYQNGNFINYFSMLGDYWTDNPKNPIVLRELIYTITEVFCFLSRMTSREAFQGKTNLSIVLHNIENRELRLESPEYVLSHYTLPMNELPYSIDTELASLIGNWKELAVDCVVWILQRFGIDTRNFRSTIRDRQQNLFNLKSTLNS